MIRSRPCRLALAAVVTSLLSLLSACDARQSSEFPPDPWRIMVAPRIETDLLCPPESSRHACVLRRWEAFHERLAPDEPGFETALELCKLGACEPGNVYSGPWLRACRVLWQEHAVLYNAITDPCSCPRGVLLTRAVMYNHHEHDQALRPDFFFHQGMAFELEAVQVKRDWRRCSKPEPGADRMLALP